MIINFGKMKISILILFFLLISTANAKDYFVATNGDDGNPGTEVSPWRTLVKAAKIAVAGDTVFVKAGIYKGPLQPRNSGTADNYINFKTYGSDEVIIEGGYEVAGWSLYNGAIYKAPFDSTWLSADWVNISGAAGYVVVDVATNWLQPQKTLSDMEQGSWYYDENEKMLFVWLGDSSDPGGHKVWSSKSFRDSANGILVDGQNYLRFEGFTLRMLGNGTSCNITGAKFIEFRNIEVYGVHTGIRNSRNCANIIMDDIAVHDTVGPGIQNNSSYSLIENSVIYHTGIVDWQRWGNTGVILMGSYNVLRNSVIYETGYKSNHGTGVLFETWGLYGESGSDTSHHNIVEDNVIYGSPEYVGINFYGSDDCVARNNVIYGMHVGVRVGIGGRAGEITEEQRYAENNKIYNNTIVNSVEAGIKVWEGTRNTDIKNNILFMNKRALLVSAEVTGEVATDYNNFSFGVGEAIRWGGDLYTFDQYRAATGNDLHSVYGDPLFVDLAENDFRLLEGSPAIDKGTPVGLPYTGPAPDMGALARSVIVGGQSSNPGPPEILEAVQE